MAIGLYDIKKTKKNLKASQPVEKNKALRPWESYETYGIQTRTVNALEAVRKAQEIVDNNNKMVQKLKLDFDADSCHGSGSGEKDPQDSEQDLGLPEPIKIKSKAGIFGLFRDMLEF